HVVTIRGGAVADHFTVDRRAARLRVLQLLQHDDTAAARDDKTVTGGVVRTRGLGRRVVVLARQRAHGVEQTAQRPVLFLAAAGEDDVLLAHLDQLHTVADTVRAGGARRGDRVVDALDLERRRQTGGHGRPHRLRDAVWADTLDTLATQDVGGVDQVGRGGAAGTGDDATARIRDIALFQAGVGDGFLHGEVGVGGGIAHEAQLLAVDQGGEIDIDGAGDLAAKAQLLVILAKTDARAAVLQRIQHRSLVVAEAGHNAHAGNDDASHADTPLIRMCGRRKY